MKEVWNAMHKVVNGTYYRNETPDDLVKLLEQKRSNDQRVLLIYGDVSTGKTWEDCTPNRGRIGRSTGPQKVPLLVRASRSLGGEAILDHCIVQVRESRGNKVLWTHPNYKE